MSQKAFKWIAISKTCRDKCTMHKHIDWHWNPLFLSLCVPFLCSLWNDRYFYKTMYNCKFLSLLLLLFRDGTFITNSVNNFLQATTEENTLKPCVRCRYVRLFLRDSLYAFEITQIVGGTEFHFSHVL